MARQRSGNSSLMQPAFAYPFCAAISETDTGHSRASESSNTRIIWGRSHFRGAPEGFGCNARIASRCLAGSILDMARSIWYKRSPLAKCRRRATSETLGGGSSARARSRARRTSAPRRRDAATEFPDHCDVEIGGRRIAKQLRHRHSDLVAHP